LTSLKKLLEFIEKSPEGVSLDEISKNFNWNRMDYIYYQKKYFGPGFSSKYVILNKIDKKILWKLSDEGYLFLQKEKEIESRIKLEQSNVRLARASYLIALLGIIISLSVYIHSVYVDTGKLIGPEFTCPNEIGDNSINVPFRNFGNVPQWTIFEFNGENVEAYVIGYKIEEKKGFREDFKIKVPIIQAQFDEGKQTVTSFSIRVNNESRRAKFQISYYGTTLLEMLLFKNKLEVCEYENINGTFKLIE